MSGEYHQQCSCGINETCGVCQPKESKLPVGPLEWFKSHGFSFDDKITIKDAIKLHHAGWKKGMTDAAELVHDEGLLPWLEVVRVESAKTAACPPPTPASSVKAMKAVAGWICAGAAPSR